MRAHTHTHTQILLKKAKYGMKCWYEKIPDKFNRADLWGLLQPACQKWKGMEKNACQKPVREVTWPTGTQPREFITRGLVPLHMLTGIPRIVSITSIRKAKVSAKGQVRAEPQRRKEGVSSSLPRKPSGHSWTQKKMRGQAAQQETEQNYEGCLHLGPNLEGEWI